MSLMSSTGPIAQRGGEIIITVNPVAGFVQHEDTLTGQTQKTFNVAIENGKSTDSFSLTKDSGMDWLILPVTTFTGTSFIFKAYYSSDCIPGNIIRECEGNIIISPTGVESCTTGWIYATLPKTCPSNRNGYITITHSSGVFKKIPVGQYHSPSPSIVIDPSTYTFDVGISSKTFTVSSTSFVDENEVFTITNLPVFLTIDKTALNLNDRTFTLTSTVNTTNASRSGTIKLYSNYYDSNVKYRNLLISQDTTPQPVISVSLSSYTFEPTSGYYDFTISVSNHDNKTFNITKTETWITINKTSFIGGGTTLRVGVSENSGMVRNGMVKITQSDNSSNYVNINITQKKFPCEASTNKTSLSFNQYGGQQEVTISTSSTCNPILDVSITSGGGWLEVQPSTLNGGGKIYVSADSKTTTGSRTGGVSISGADNTINVAISQSGVPEPYLYVSPTNHVYGRIEEITKHVTINTNGTVTGVSLIDGLWLSVSWGGTGTTNFSVTPTQNYSSDARVATILITSSNGKSLYFFVAQEGSTTPSGGGSSWSNCMTTCMNNPAIIDEAHCKSQCGGTLEQL